MVTRRDFRARRSRSRWRGLSRRETGTRGPHTLIEAGRPDEAREVIVKAEPLMPEDNPRSAEAWRYVRARLAEAWGLSDVAAALYATIEAPSARDVPTDVRVMAAKRRAAGKW